MPTRCLPCLPRVHSGNEESLRTGFAGLPIDLRSRHRPGSGTVAIGQCLPRQVAVSVQSDTRPGAARVARDRALVLAEAISNTQSGIQSAAPRPWCTGLEQGPWRGLRTRSKLASRGRPQGFPSVRGSWLVCQQRGGCESTAPVTRPRCCPASRSGTGPGDRLSQVDRLRPGVDPGRVPAHGSRPSLPPR